MKDTVESSSLSNPKLSTFKFFISELSNLNIVRRILVALIGFLAVCGLIGIAAIIKLRTSPTRDELKSIRQTSLIKEDKQKSEEELERSCEKMNYSGDHIDCYNLAYLYLTQMNPRSAFEVLEKTCKEGDDLDACILFVYLASNQSSLTGELNREKAKQIYYQKICLGENCFNKADPVSGSTKVIPPEIEQVICDSRSSSACFKLFRKKPRNGAAENTHQQRPQSARLFCALTDHEVCIDYAYVLALVGETKASEALLWRLCQSGLKTACLEPKR